MRIEHQPIFDAGYEAAVNGRPCSDNPWVHMDIPEWVSRSKQWRRGWEAGFSRDVRDIESSPYFDPPGE